MNPEQGPQKCERKKKKGLLFTEEIEKMSYLIARYLSFISLDSNGGEIFHFKQTFEFSIEAIQYNMAY